MVTTISGSQYRRTPINNVTPFTYRDGSTFLEILTKLDHYIKNDLTEELDEFLQATIAEIADNKSSYEGLLSTALTEIERRVMSINNRVGSPEIQRITLTDDYTLSVDPALPDNHEITFILTQDIKGGHSVLLPESVSGDLTVNNSPRGETHFSLTKYGNVWRLSQWDSVTGGEYDTKITELLGMASNVATSIKSLIDGRLDENGSGLSDSVNARIDERAGVHASTFGIVADGVTDNGSKLADFINYLSANGGVGVLPAGTIVYSSPWNVRYTPDNPTKSFILRGAGKHATVLAYTGPGTGPSMQSPKGVAITDLTLDGGFNVSRQVGHGMSFHNPHDVHMERVHVTNYASSSVLWHVADNEASSLRPSSNYLIDCSYDGMDVANNGFNFVNLYDSYMVNPVGKRLGRAVNNTPGYGAQLKNGCRNTHIVNANIDGAIGGIVFASDNRETPGSGPQLCSASGNVSHSQYGLLTGRSNFNKFDVIVDMADSRSGDRAVQIAGMSENNVIDVSLHNVPTTVVPIYVSGHDNSFTVKKISSDIPKIFEIGSGVARTKMVLESYPLDFVNASSKVLDNSTRVDNRIASTQDAAWMNAISETESSFLRFNNPSSNNTYIGFNHSSGTFNFRSKGQDALFFNSTLFSAATDNAMSLGNATRRFTQLYAANSTIITSDIREKQQISDDLSAELRAWEKVGFKKFKMNDAVTIKGDSARWHFGLIAQEIKDAFESEGLDPFKYGILCHDSWEGGDRYGVRYEEAMALEMALTRAKLDKLG